MIKKLKLSEKIMVPTYHCKPNLPPTRHMITVNSLYAFEQDPERLYREYERGNVVMLGPASIVLLFEVNGDEVRPLKYKTFS